MIIRLSAEVRQFLNQQPEYGMGYQVAHVRMDTGREEEGYIFNGLFFVPGRDLADAEAGDPLAKLLMKLQVLDAIVGERLDLPIGHVLSVSDVTLTSRPEETLCGGPYASQKKQGGKTDNFEKFVRFLPFKKDSRITVNHGLMPGTLVTTMADSRQVRTGIEATARYSLQYREPAVQIFTIEPPPGLRAVRGQLDPGHDGAGCGEEIILVNGSPDGTVFGPTEIPAS